jgi:hypothetical protein
MMSPGGDSVRASLDGTSRAMSRTGAAPVGAKALSILQTAGASSPRSRAPPTAAAPTPRPPRRLWHTPLPPRAHAPPLPACFHPPTADFARTEANAARRALRLAAKPQPEVHLLGEICGGSGFGEGRPVACKWALETGDGAGWVLLEGARGGQTQTDTPDAGTDTVVWAHPIDAHYVAGGMQVRGAAGGQAMGRGAAGEGLHGRGSGQRGGV